MIGQGGHAKVLRDCLAHMNIEILGYITDDESDNKLGDDSWLKAHAEEYKAYSLVNGLGSVDIPTKRQDIFKTYKALGFSFQTIIHPSAIIAQDVTMGEGCQIMAGVIVQSGTKLGNNVLLNTRASIDHDCHIGDHSHIAPGCVFIRAGFCRQLLSYWYG